MAQVWDEQSVRRIVRSVLSTEKTLRNRRPYRGRIHLVSGEGGSFDRVKGLLVGAMLTTDTTHTIDNVIATKGRSPLADSTSTTEALTVQNGDLAWAGDDNAPAYAEYCASDGLWYLYQVKCPV